MLPLVPIPPQPPSTEEPPAKRHRVTPSCEFDDDVNDETPELTRYLNADVTAETCADILSWWRDNQMTYPGLSIITRRILCIITDHAVKCSK